MSRRGLSVLEAMVAIAILAIAIVPLLEIQSQIARTHQRYEALYERVTMHNNAFAILRDLNPSLNPEGRIELAPGVLMTWTSRQIGDEVRSTVYPNGDGQFDVALFEVSVVVASEIPNRTDAFVVERLGWRQAAGTTQDRLDPADPFDRDRMAYP